MKTGAMVRLASVIALGLVSGAAAVRSRLRASVVSVAGSNATPAVAQLQFHKKAALGKMQGQTAREAFFKNLVQQGLDDKRSVLRLAKEAEPKMDLGDALQSVEGKLPSAVATLVHTSFKHGDKSTEKGTVNAACQQGGAFSEASLQNARQILNDMVFSAIKEYDTEWVKYYEFKARNRETYSQVVSDLAIAASDLSRLEEQRVEHTEGSAAMDRQRGEIMGVIMKETLSFKSEKMTDEQEMTIRSNDLAVFDFILQLTACGEGPTSCDAPGAPALLQQGSATQRCKRPLSLCNTGGEMLLRFNDTKLRRKLETMMTTSARRALRQALGQVQSGKATELLQRNGLAVQTMVMGSDAQPSNVSNFSTTSAMPTNPVDEVPVTEEPDPAGQWKKCVDAPYDCAFVHDMMSLEWGKFRDLYDDLKNEMDRKQREYDELMKNLKGQLADTVHQKTRHIESISAIVSEVNIIQQTVMEKNEEKNELQKEYDEETAESTKIMSHIMFNQICAVRMIRNSLMGCSDTTPPSNISDCDVSDWVGDRCEDSHGNELMCDDSCPQPNPYDCGGVQTITRDIVVAPNAAGIPCPALRSQRKCNQFKCPVDCSLSEWTGWGKCSAECDSGVQTQTRDVFTKPLNGGEACDALDDTRPCNTMSCDRDCTLEDWTAWSACSMSCSMEGFTGQQTRVRNIKVPLRALGTCPADDSSERWEAQDCNTHKCAGDEVCIANMDLVLAIDASGSLKPEGFKAMKSFAANLTARYRGEYYGQQDVKIGIALFGQGHVENLPSGATTITPAENALPLTADMDKVVEKIEALQFQGGFTNVAQALALSDVMLQQGGREDAQSAVMVISDGKYSMEYQTAQQVKKLKDKNVMLFMLPVTEFDGDQVETMKSWASWPTESNFERIPGLESLKYNTELFAERIVAKFCPDSFSPSSEQQKEEQQEYMLIHENGWPNDDCGKWVYVGLVQSMDDCAKEARTRDHAGFSFGRSYAENRCYTEAIQVTMDDWHMWAINRASPPCPNGRWLFNPYFDTYVLKPLETVTDYR